MAKRHLSRRNVLKNAGASAAILGLAGCLGSEDGGDGSGGGDGGGSDGGSTGDGGPSGGDGVSELLIAGWHPPENHTFEVSIYPWIDRVEERTDIDITYRGGGQLGDATELMDLLMEGACDIAHVTPSYYSDRLPLTQGMMLPGITPDIVVGTDAFYDLMTPHNDGWLYENEWSEYGLRPLLPIHGDPYQLYMVDQQVVELSDFEGLSLRTSGGVTDWTAEALGATAVPTAGGEIYQSLERGTLDGDFNTGIAGQLFSTQEVVDYCTTNANFHTTVLIDAINEDTWNEFSEEQRTVVLEEADEVPRMYSESQLDHIEGLFDQYENEYGVETYEVPEENLQRWNETIRDGAVDRWIDQENSDTRQELIDLYGSKIDELSE